MYASHECLPLLSLNGKISPNVHTPVKVRNVVAGKIKMLNLKWPLHTNSRDLNEDKADWKMNAHKYWAIAARDGRYSLVYFY